MGHKIIVWDPLGEYWDGSLVEERTASILEQRGVVALPVNPPLLVTGGVSGFHKRSWGSGWPLEFVSPRMCCPLLMHVPAKHSAVHWAFRLVPDPVHQARASKGETFTQGVLRLVGDPGQGVRFATISTNAPLITGELGKADANGGWSFKGSGTFVGGGEGFYGFSLYGTLPGTRVAWAAVSVTAR